MRLIQGEPERAPNTRGQEAVLYAYEKLDHIPSSCMVLMVHVVKGRQQTHQCRRLNRRDGV